MRSIKVLQSYLHQGERLNPKLVYSVPTPVADGMIALGLAVASAEAPDETLAHLTWETGTVRADAVTPAPITHLQE